MIHYQGFGVTVHHGDCIEVLREMPDASVDAVVTDPPYGLGFMGKEWDSAAALASRPPSADATDEKYRNVFPRTGKGPAAVAFDGPAFQSWCQDWAAECLRVLKPGGHMLAFGGTRTYHRLACAIEDAGFEIRDSIAWLQGQGFPKSLDVSKAIDKASGKTAEAVGVLKTELRQVFDKSGLTLSDLNAQCGFEASGYLRESSTWAQVLPSPEKWKIMRDVIGCDEDYSFAFRAAEREVIGMSRSGLHRGSGATVAFGTGRDRRGVEVTAPATDDAQRWEGWGTALRPCHEPIVVARKPLQGTVAQNVLTHGTGALNIDATRIAHVTVNDGNLADNPHLRATINGGNGGHIIASEAERRVVVPNQAGRWPPNVALAHSPECEPAGVTTETVGGGASGSSGFVEGYGSGDGFVGREVAVQTWRCAPGCQVAELDGQSGDLTSPWVGNRRGNTVGAKGGRMFGSEQENDAALPKVEYADGGGASRYFLTVEQRLDDLPIRAFYTAKAGSSERPVVGDARHVTVKPLDLMRWLVRLVTPPGGMVCDPFAGSGTTAEACVIEGFHCITVEQDESYLPLIESRVARQRDPVAHTRLTKKESDAPTLFDDL